MKTGRNIMLIHIRIFSILYSIHLISRIKLEPVNHDWRPLKVFLCLPLTVDTLV